MKTYSKEVFNNPAIIYMPVLKEKERQAKLICKALEISRDDFSKIIEYIKKYT